MSKYSRPRASSIPTGKPFRASGFFLGILAVGAITGVIGAVILVRSPSAPPAIRGAAAATDKQPIQFQPRSTLDDGGYLLIEQQLAGEWPPDSTLAQLGQRYQGLAQKGIENLKARLTDAAALDDANALQSHFLLATLYNSEGEPEHAAECLIAARKAAEASDTLAAESLYSLIFLQGVTELRRGENENCILCRGESSCILPISKAAQHTFPEGSTKAIEYFTEYLQQFPMDVEVAWLLNIAHMTLGQYPDQVNPKFLIPLDEFVESEFDIGRFRDIGHVVGLNHLTQAGGAIMEDFDNDGLLDVVITSYDPVCNMQYLRNAGDGKFIDRTQDSGLSGQTGGLNCVQTDFNNDGNMDIYVIRGAWVGAPVRPSLLQNDGTGKFTDVTETAGLLVPVNSIAATWADYDNDGWLDLFVCCERQPGKLYHNQRDGTFREVATEAGISRPANFMCKGANWLDYDNDGYQDLFVNYLSPQKPADLFHNNGNGTFTEVSSSLGIDGPRQGFSCWTWDYNNDGWLDIFSTCYDRSLGDAVVSMLGKGHALEPSRLYLNMRGNGFKDVTKDAGLDMVFFAMGSNYGDFDNDGFLDMYLGTGEPNLATLIPNRMFKNVNGERFSDITASSGTGSLQKGHGVACGDWDRDGNVDIFIEMGGVTKGDMYHNILFQNPGHDNNWLTIKLIGTTTNRAAIGARIKLVTQGPKAQTIYRHISSGSSFGANPLQQTIGLGETDKVAELEITWPTSGTSQTFHGVDVDQAISITEFGDTYTELDWRPITRTGE